MRFLRILPSVLLGAAIGFASLALNAQAHPAAPAEHAAQPDAHGAPAHEAAAPGTAPHAAEAGHAGGAQHGPEVRLPFMKRGLTSGE